VFLSAVKMQIEKEEIARTIFNILLNVLTENLKPLSPFVIFCGLIRKKAKANYLIVNVWFVNEIKFSFNRGTHNYVHG